jgi:hypothetical protein
LGYKASIEIYQNKLLLCSEIAHRLVNSQTVLEIIEDCFHKAHGNTSKGRELVMCEIVGQTVMTK